MNKLSNSEMYIMLQILSCDRDLYFNEIVDLLDEKNWAESTIRNFLSRIISKGYLTVIKEGKRNKYRVVVSEIEIIKKSKNIIEKIYENSIKTFIAELYDSNLLTDEDLLEIRQYIDEKIN
ncbi:MAG TPA: BlaI/MecI/CopY family transcriptional regulator [Tissierellaceae bacterium]